VTDENRGKDVFSLSGTERNAVVRRRCTLDEQQVEELQNVKHDAHEAMVKP
jgi:hypothetical protein